MHRYFGVWQKGQRDAAEKVYELAGSNRAFGEVIFKVLTQLLQMIILLQQSVWYASCRNKN